MVFCPECGTKVREEQNSVATAVGKDDDGNDLIGVFVASIIKEGVKVFLNEGLGWFNGKRGKKLEAEAPVMSMDCGKQMYGIILTNVRILASKLGTTERHVQDLLENFIERKRQFGVSYQLADVGNYTYRKGSVWGKKKTVHLDAGSALSEYMDVLMDIHQYELEHSLPESNYLFIMGGDDVVPTGRIRHYLADDVKFRDKDIETDILYEYPYGAEMVEKLENQQLFHYDQLFYVGRLPMGTDMTLEDLHSYLKRNIACSTGIPMHEAYIQCDPNWKRMTATAASKLVEGNWLRDLEGYLIDGCYFNGLILSPLVASGNVHQVFNKDASVFFFNLHGSNAENVRGYFGNYCPLHPSKPCVSAILPEHLSACSNPNLMYSGACYGASYIGRNKNQSMVLSSIYGNSLLFVGSSRMAFGIHEPLDAETLCVPIAFGDILAKGFWDSLMEGNVVGKAIFDGSSAAFKMQPGHPIYATTIVEFNVFGDPTLRLDVSCATRNADVDTEVVSRIADTNDYACVAEKVELSSGQSSSSILDMVRSRVDDNVLRIHDLVGRHLYAFFGVQPRPADSIFRLKYADGSKVLSFSYDVNSDSAIPVRYVVETTEEGKVLKIITSK